MNFLVEDIARFSILVPAIFYLFSRSKDKNLQVLFYFLVFVILHHVFYNSLSKRESSYTEIFNGFYTPIELFFTALYIRPNLRTPANKRFLLISLLVYFISWTPFVAFSQTQEFVSYIRAVTYSLILIYSLLYYYEQMRFPQTIFIYSQRAFWGISGFLIFAAGTFFVFLFDQFSIHVKGFLEQYVYVHALLFITRNLLFSLAIIIKPGKTPYEENVHSLT